MKFENLVATIEQTHQHFHQQAVKAVNVSLTVRNWLIGYYIVEFEQKGEDRAAYGARLLAKIAERCKNIKGVDERSLRNFRKFYIQYAYLHKAIDQLHTDFSIRGSLTTELDFNASKELIEIRGSLTTESSEDQLRVPAQKILSKLSFTHLEQLISIEDPLKRIFYEIECIKGTWSVRELKRQISTLYFERSGMSAKPELLSELTQQKTETAHANELVKSVYAFEFLGLNAKDAVEESDLETALLDHLQEFMMEIGHGFCLEARQKKILIGDEYFFVDLVFYHRILNPHYALEFRHEKLKCNKSAIYIRKA